MNDSSFDHFSTKNHDQPSNLGIPHFRTKPYDLYKLDGISWDICHAHGRTWAIKMVGAQRNQWFNQHTYIFMLIWMIYYDLLGRNMLNQSTFTMVCVKEQFQDWLASRCGFYHVFSKRMVLFLSFPLLGCCCHRGVGLQRTWTPHWRVTYDRNIHQQSRGSKRI